MMPANSRPRNHRPPTRKLALRASSLARPVREVAATNPATGFGELVRGALTVGRDHIAATVNTLFLAYAGASLPLLVLFTTSGDSLGTVATSEVVAVEIVRSLSGSIGLIAAVPLTTVLAAALTRQGAEADQSSAVERRSLGRASYALRGRLPPEQDQLVSTPCSACMRHGCRMQPSG